MSKLYRDGRVEALIDVSLEILRGEYVAIMGPSGSGKSTLLNMLGALDRPTRGEVYFEGQALGAKCSWGAAPARLGNAANGPWGRNPKGTRPKPRHSSLHS